jgi:FKBP-type peptidyl-prolyl cis-trans isomerase FkpA
MCKIYWDASMKSLAGIAGIVGLWMVCGLSGCEGLKDPSTSSPDPVPTAKVEPSSQPPHDLTSKQADLPEHPKGAGEIDADAPQELTPTGSGLYYRILRNSDGRKPKATDTVVAHYKGWLDAGKQFDSSYDRGEPSEFPLNGVVAGWREGLQLIGEGGMIELEIPGALGYPQGRPGIPPNATLHFIVELKEVR